MNTHQYSATHFERDLTRGHQEDNKAGVHIAHSSPGIPGAFFNYDVSPILVVHTETRQSFAHFLTSCVFPPFFPSHSARELMSSDAFAGPVRSSEECSPWRR